MFLHNYPYTLLDYSSALKHLDPLHYLPGCYLFLMQSVNGTVFKYHLFVFSICYYCSSVCTLSNNCYNSLYKYVRVTSVTKNCTQHHGIKFDLTICIVYSRLIIIHVNPVICSEFLWLVISVIQHFMIFWYSIFSLYL